MKKIVALCLALCMCFFAGALLTACNQTPAGDENEKDPLAPVMPKEPSEGLTYELNEDGTGYVMTGFGSCTDYNIRIADTYRDLPVVKISEYAITAHPPIIASITLGKNITELESQPFSDFTNDTIRAYFVAEGNPAYKAENGVLYSKDGTTLIRYPSGSAQKSFTLPASVTTIEKGAFNANVNLATLVIPEGVTRIESRAFWNMDSLKTVTIPASVTDMGTWLTCASAITSITVSEENGCYKSVDGVLYSKDGTTLLEYPASKSQTSFTVPNGVRTIGEHAFFLNTFLQNIVFPEGLVEIEAYAFENCQALATFNFPTTLTTIGDSAFSYSGIQVLDIPDTVTHIGEWAFQANPLTSVSVGEGLGMLARCTFAGCTALSEVQLRNTLDSISYGVFRDCTALTQINFFGIDLDWRQVDLAPEWCEGSGVTKIVTSEGEIAVNP